MRIEFDAAKRAATLEARGLDIGFLNGAMVVLVWTPRQDAYRIISMRKANEREHRLYGSRF